MIVPEVQQILEVGQLALCALCQAPAGDPLRTQPECELSSYAWRACEHQIIFEALRDFPSRTADIIRPQLSSRLTRKGFPDLNFEIHFEPRDIHSEHAADLLRTLARSRR